MKIVLYVNLLLNLILSILLIEKTLTDGRSSGEKESVKGYEKRELGRVDGKNSDRLLGSSKLPEIEVKKVDIPTRLVTHIFGGFAILPDGGLLHDVAMALGMTSEEKHICQKLVRDACKGILDTEWQRAIEDPEKTDEPGVHLILSPDLSAVDDIVSRFASSVDDVLGEERAEVMLELLKEDERFRSEEKVINIAWQPKFEKIENEGDEEWEFRITAFDSDGNSYEYGLSAKPFGRYAHLIEGR